MQRFLLSFFLIFSLAAVVQAQVTQLVSNRNLDLVVQLGTGKALLTDPGMKTLWVTDATTGGTFKLSDTLQYSDAGGLLNGNYIFAAASPTFGDELWITDGTKEGTKLVKDIYPGKTGAEPHEEFALLNGFLYFSAASPNVGRELWRTNGTEGGTTMVKDITAGPAGSALKGGFDIYSNGSFILFSVTTIAEGYELWRSDGTEGGTHLLKDINPGAASSRPAAYHAYNNAVLFWAEKAGEGRELWRTDGTNGGTVLVKDILPGAASSINAAFPMPNVSVLYPFNNRLLFMANDGVHGSEIWTTDGTTTGTKLLKDINDKDDLTFISLLNAVPMNGKLFFAAYHPETGSELWETDGTTGGTKLFKEILTGSDGGFPFLLPNLKYSNASSWPVHQGSHFYFQFGLPGDAGVELWKSDGTAAGTVKVKTTKTKDSDFGNLSYIYTPSGFYFSTDDGVHGDELWKTDGTEAGTVLVLNLNPNVDPVDGAKGSDIAFFPFPVNNAILLTATDGDNEFMGDLYRLDGVHAPLPVTLQAFTVSLAGADGQLKWQTASEENTKQFVIERSEDGRQFTRIGTVAAAGSSSDRKHYAFTDLGVAHSGKAITYYRLRMQDKDGQESVSKTVSLSLNGSEGFTAKLLGNPVQSSIRLAVNKAAAPVNVIIEDASGRMVKSLRVNSENGVVTIPASDLLTGAYFLVAESGGKTSVAKFFKQ